MINKIARTVADAWWGEGRRHGPHRRLRHRRIPNELIDGLIEQARRTLPWSTTTRAMRRRTAALLRTGRVRKIICSFPRQVDSYVFDELYRSGKLELELVPQGNLPSASARAAPASARSSAPPAMHRAGQRQGNPGDRRPPLCAGVSDSRRPGLIKGETGDRWAISSIARRRAFRTGDGRGATPRWRACTRLSSSARSDPENI